MPRASTPPITRCGSAAAATANLKFPHILGRDFSGVVSALGPGVTDFKVGDAVFGVTDPGDRGLLCREDRDQGGDHRQKARAAGRRRGGGAGADQPDRDCGRSRTPPSSRRGETILIQGGAGGVAGFAIQLAKHIGATVITTASARNHDYVKSLGADRAIDYNARGFHQGRAGLRRGVRHGRRRGAGALLRRA